MHALKTIVSASLLCACLFASRLAAAEIIKEEFNFASSLDGTSPLIARAIFPQGDGKLPLMVVQHGYGGTRDNVAFSAQRFAARGFFCLCIDTRGNGGSAGQQDDGGVEIMDIHDGIQTAIGKYPSKIEPSDVSMVGYSNGGGNVFFSTVRFPYLFRGGMSFFGIPDYGMWNAGGSTYGVTKFVGGTVKEQPDKYLVRNSLLALGNLSGTRFHTVYDEQEAICPVAMQQAFVQAVQRLSYPHLFVHVSKASDAQRWTHGYNQGHLNAAEDLFIEDLLKNKSPLKPMSAAGELVVLGFVVTPRFTCVLGRGDDAAARLKYEFKDGRVKFALTPMTSDPKAKVVVTLAEKLEKGAVSVDGKSAPHLDQGGKMAAEGTLNSSIEFTSGKP